MRRVLMHPLHCDPLGMQSTGMLKRDTPLSLSTETEGLDKGVSRDGARCSCKVGTWSGAYEDLISVVREVESL